MTWIVTGIVALGLFALLNSARPAVRKDPERLRRHQRHWWELALALVTGAVIAGVVFTLEDRREESRLERAQRAQLIAALTVKDDLTDMNLVGHDLQGIILIGRDLSGSNLSGVDFTGAILNGAILTDTVLSGADLTDAQMVGVDLQDALMWEAILINTDLATADLRNVRMADTNLAGADLSSTKMDGAILINSLIAGADLTEANIDEAAGFDVLWDQATIWPEGLEPRYVEPLDKPNGS